MMKPHDTVVLRRPLPDHGLEEGDVGAVVHRHSSDAFDVEFISGEGRRLQSSPSMPRTSDRYEAVTYST